MNGERAAPKLGTELWTAIGGGGIDVCYQPKVEMATGIVRGAEALVRWYHPRLGRVRPAKLVRVAERTGAIRPLTMWVMQQALAECRTWRDLGWDLSVAVNLSARNLVDRRLAPDVAKLLDDVGVPAASLTLEITETMVVGESQRSLDVVQSLVELGVKISCDDFGTGYASLARLRRLPINEIKVDRSFVCRMADDDTDRAITRSVLALGRGLGLTTVAEGVEDRDGWDILRAFGCDQAQGFLVSRPLAAERFREWMARQPESARPKVARPVTALDPSAGAAVAAASASGSIAAAASASASSVAPASASASVAVSAKSAQASRS
jgi:EAL domain-containing protein (putative c-di-GMP-specific phosphodiesterase class I)